MPVFYQGRYARVTHRSFETWCPYRSYRIGELRQVGIVRRRKAQPSVVARPLSSSGLAALAVVIATQQVRGGGAWPSALTVAALIMAVGAVWSARRWHGSWVYELWGLHQGRWERLFECADVIVFGQVKRGLQRAIEWNRDTV